MSRIFLVRHGQAGLRHNYDTLSPVGRQQAKLLGGWFQAENIKFQQVFAGNRKRQIETAEIAVGVPELHDGFTEFDLDVVYAGMAPILCQKDEQFNLEYNQMLDQMKAHDAPVHRQWNRCDALVFQAWHSGRYEIEGESWKQFKERVLGTLDLIQSMSSGEDVAVFTSATPIGLLLAAILGAADEHAMQLAGASYNSAVTVLQLRDGKPRMAGFNSIAHISDPTLRTLR